MHKHLLLLVSCLFTYVLATQDLQIGKSVPLFQMQTQKNAHLALDPNTTDNILLFLSFQEKRVFKQTCKTGSQTVKKILFTETYKKHKKVMQYMITHDFDEPFHEKNYLEEYREPRKVFFKELADEPELLLIFLEKYPKMLFIRDFEKHSRVRLAFQKGMARQGDTFLKTVLDIAEKNQKKLLNANTSTVNYSCMPTRFYHITLNTHLLDRICKFVDNYEKSPKVTQKWYNKIFSYYNEELGSKYKANMSLTPLLKTEEITLEELEYLKSANDAVIKLLLGCSVLLLKNMKISQSAVYVQECKKTHTRTINKIYEWEEKRKDPTPKRQAALKKLIISSTCLTGLWIVAKNMLGPS
ncbi:MAG: hypothetical protein AAF380_01510 [Bacteroidota bacterium]